VYMDISWDLVCIGLFVDDFNMLAVDYSMRYAQRLI
jgi:hypothetical protein